MTVLLIRCPRVLVFAIQDQLARLGKIRSCMWDSQDRKARRPKCVLVHLEPLLVDPAEHHRADAAVADLQRFGPCARQAGRRYHNSKGPVGAEALPLILSRRRHWHRWPDGPLPAVAAMGRLRVMAKRALGNEGIFIELIVLIE